MHLLTSPAAPRRRDGSALQEAASSRAHSMQAPRRRDTKTRGAWSSRLTVDEAKVAELREQIRTSSSRCHR